MLTLNPSVVLSAVLGLLLAAGPHLAVAPLMAAEQVQVSDYFAVKQAGGALRGRYQEIYARENRNEKFRLIGTTEPTNWDKPFSGSELKALERSLMALSSDGKTLLYWHQKRGPSRGPDKAEGIYRYRVGEGETLLYPRSELRTFWSLYSKPLPRNVMAIRGESICTMEEKCALNADDGSVTPLAMYGSSPLHLAAYAGHLEGARSALDRGAGVDDENYFGFTALEIAIKKGHEEIAVLLLERGADYRRKLAPPPSPIQLAVHLHRWQVLEALHAELDDPALRFYAFCILPGCRFGDFIANDIADYRQEDLPRLLGMMLDAGLDPATASEPLVYWLLEEGRWSQATLDALRLLIDHGVRVDQPEPEWLWTPLHYWAVQLPSDDFGRDVLGLLISNMQSLEARDKRGLTALQTVLLQPTTDDRFAKALLLIEAGADDSVQYFCRDETIPTGISVREKLIEWGGAPPAKWNCRAYMRR